MLKAVKNEENWRPTRVGNIVVPVVVTIVVRCAVVGGAISVATFTSARQITGQHVAIKITARQLSPQIVRSSKNVASARATTKTKKTHFFYTFFLFCGVAVCWLLVGCTGRKIRTKKFY